MQPGPQGLIGLGQPAALRPYTPIKGVRGVTWAQVLALDPEVALDPAVTGSAYVERTGAGATTLAIPGDFVGSLKNWGSKGGWLVAPSDAARPSLQQMGTGRYLQFDGLDDAMSGALEACRGVAGWTAVVGLKSIGSAGIARTAFTVLTPGGLTRASVGFAATSGIAQTLGRRDNAVGAASANGTTHANVDGVMTGLGDYTNTDAFVRWNGAQDGANTSWLTAGVTPSDGGDVTLGAFSASSNYFEGRVYSALFFGRVLSAQELYLVERYVAKTGNISI